MVVAPLSLYQSTYYTCMNMSILSSMVHSRYTMTCQFTLMSFKSSGSENVTSSVWYVYVCIRIDVDVYVCSVCTSTLMFWPISQREFLSTLDWMSVVQSVYADCRKSHTQNKLSNHMELPRDILN